MKTQEIHSLCSNRTVESLEGVVIKVLKEGLKYTVDWSWYIERFHVTGWYIEHFHVTGWYIERFHVTGWYIYIAKTK